MTLHGRIQNGVVVLDGGISLPDGIPVTVFITAEQPELSSPPPPPAPGEPMSSEERRRILAVIKSIASQPDENPGDVFSGADHDQALYGEP